MEAFMNGKIIFAFGVLLQSLGLCSQAWAQDFDAAKEILGMPLSAEDAQFVQQQNQRTKTLLSQVDPVLAKALADRAGELAAKNAPSRVNYFGVDHFVKDGNVVKSLAVGGEELVIPGSVLPANAKFSGYRYSPNQKFIAYGYSMFGSDWQVWEIYDLTEKKTLKEDGTFVFKGFGGTLIGWTPDSKKFLYTGENNLQDDFSGNQNPTINLHTVGQPKSSDKVIFKDFEKIATSRWGAVALTNDLAVVYRTQGVAIIPTVSILVSLSSGKKLHIQSPNKYLGNSPSNVIVGAADGKIYLRSASEGKNFGVVVFDAKKSGKATTLIASQKDSVLYQAQLLGNKILTQYIDRDLKISFKLFDLQGKLVAKMRPSDFGYSDLSHPSLPLTDGDSTSTFGYFNFSSVKSPPVTFKVDLEKNEFIKLNNSAEIAFDASKITETMVTVDGLDGFKIPMLVYQRNDMKSAAKFAYLYSYGFIGIPNLSQWNRKFQLALEMGGVVAIPMIRGGGEFGADHQLAGTNDRQKTFDDLVAASRWLKKNLALEENRVIAVGRSFGGLSGAVHFVHNQDEFSLISAIVPVTNWEKHFLMSGWWMGDDFGIHRSKITGKARAEDREELMDRNLSWDPAANLQKLEGKKLIPTIFFTNQYDTNTTPIQTYSFMKTLTQQFPGQEVYMMEHANGGHGARAELVDEFLFIAKNFGLRELSPIK